MKPLLLAAALAAQTPTAELMVVGRSATLREAAPVAIKRAAVRVAGRRCRLAAATPLAALARTRLALRLRDYGSCGRRPADAGGLYVRAVEGEVARGSAGWVYKLGRRVGTAGAGDPSARVGAGSRLLWFWCRMGARGCQRTLEVRPDRAALAPGETLTVKVTAYDDDGEGTVAAGASVALGSTIAVAGPDGVATLTAGPAIGTLEVVAGAEGMVRSFPVDVRVR